MDDLIPIRLSPTKLQAWFESECPAKWKYEREWEPVGGNKFASSGTAVHEILEGRREVDDLDSKEVHTFVTKLKDLRRDLGIEIISTELKLVWEILPGVIWAEVIDVYGRIEDEYIILDYKTNWGKGWKRLKADGLTLPQALAFQTPSYLLKPPADIWKGEWPKKIMYLVAPLWSQGEIWTADSTEEDEHNLLTAIKMAADAMRLAEQTVYPKVRGKNCLECPMAPICYETPGWEEQIVKRGRADG